MSPDVSREILATVNGPAPTGLVSSVEKGNSSLEIFCQRRLGRMPSVVRERNGAYGFASVKRTVRWSTAVARTPDQFAYSGLLSAGSCALVTVKTTSAVVTGVPSLNF